MTYKYEPDGLHFEVDSGNSLMTSISSYHSFRESNGIRHDAVGSFSLSEVGIPYGSKTASMFNGKSAYFGGAAYLRDLNAGNSSVSQDGTRDFSMCAWFNQDAAATGVIASQHVNSGNHRQWILGLSSGKPWCHKANADGTYGNDNVLGSAASTGAWNFIYAYWEMGVGSGLSVNDGTIQTSAHAVGMKDGTANLQVGAYNGATLYFKGYLAQWVMWDKILTAQEVTDMYNGGSGNKLIGWDI